MCIRLTRVFLGVLTWSLVIPFDVVKSRLQADEMSNPRYSSYSSCVKSIYKEAGLSGFTRGFHLMALRAAPVNAITFYFYELSIMLLS